MSRSRLVTIILLSGCATWLGCSAQVPTTQFVNPGFDFGFVERVAVLPLENQSNDRQASVRATRLLITELLASGALDVVEPGEVQAALDRLAGGGNPPTTQQVLELGQSLQVQAIIVGSVNQSEVIRSGNISIPVVTMDLHMLETETGKAVWAGTNTSKGGTTGARVLGTGGEPISATTRRCVQALLETLIQ